MQPLDTLLFPLSSPPHFYIQPRRMSTSRTPPPPPTPPPSVKSRARLRVGRASRGRAALQQPQGTPLARLELPPPPLYRRISRLTNPTHHNDLRCTATPSRAIRSTTPRRPPCKPSRAGFCRARTVPIYSARCGCCGTAGRALPFGSSRGQWRC